MTNVVTVRSGDCPCPGRPHLEEKITLDPELTLPVASAALVAIGNAEATVSAQQAAIMAAYLPASIREWTFTDENQKPVPITRENLERFVPWDAGGLELSEAADALYSERLMRPLVARMLKASQSSPTPPETPPSLLSGFTPPEPPAPFSLADLDGKPSEVPVP